MKLTKKSSYALNIIGYMMENPSELVSSKDIAKKYGLSEYFVTLVLRDLKESKIVYPKKGPGGGYKLAINKSKITARKILEAVGEKWCQKRVLENNDNSEMCVNFIYHLNDHLEIFLDEPITELRNIA